MAPVGIQSYGLLSLKNAASENIISDKFARCGGVVNPPVNDLGKDAQRMIAPISNPWNLELISCGRAIRSKLLLRVKAAINSQYSQPSPIWS